MPIHIQNRRSAPRLTTPQLRAMLRVICTGVGHARSELSVTMTDDATIHEINKTWRHKDKPTDVLSFSQLEGGALPGAKMLGDVIVSYDTAARQAARFGHELGTEIARLLVHGVLHCLGHDHVHGGLQARRMKNEEQRLLALLHEHGLLEESNADPVGCLGGVYAPRAQASTRARR